MPDGVLVALALTTLAGLSTGVGSALAFFARRSSTGFLASGLGFSAGVMIYVSFIELFPDGRSRLGGDDDPGQALVAVMCFLGGVAVPAVIDYLVPETENPHEAALVSEMDDPPSPSPDGAQAAPTSPDAPEATHDSGRAPPPSEARGLRRLGLLTAAAIAIHNFPEGLATFFASLHDPAVGVPIAIAVALHNIPEGISVAVPIYYATGDRGRAFRLSFLSGLSEPVGALAGYLVLGPFLNDALLGGLLAAVAGVMVFLSLDQLIPNAKKYDRGHQSLYGLLAGMAVMALSLLAL
jgi:ZIP family zinc transporter